MKKLFFCFILIPVFTTCFPKYNLHAESNDSLQKTEQTDWEIYGNEISISRAQIAKMLAFLHNDMQQIISLYENSYQKRFSDTSPEKWHDIYINAVATKNIMSGTEQKFFPDDGLSISQTQILLDKLIPQNKNKLKITDETQNKLISYALWTNLFKQYILNPQSENKIQEEELIVLATSKNCNKLPKFNLITDNGYYTCDGIDIEEFTNKKIKVLTREKEILAIEAIWNNQEILLQNCTFIESGKNFIKISCGGTNIKYTITNIQIPQQTSNTCNIKLLNGQVISVEFNSEQHNDIVTNLDNKN